MRSSRRREWAPAHSRARAAVNICASAGLLAAVAMVPGSASAQTSASSGGDSAAVITPLLEFMDFGDTVGFPLMCSDALGNASSGANQLGLTNQAQPFFVQIADQCSSMSAQGDQHMQQAIAQSSQLTPINPVLNPAISALATGLQSAGANYGSSLSPFGPTVAGLGGTLAFFEGSGAGNGGSGSGTGGAGSPANLSLESGSANQNNNNYNLAAESDSMEVVVNDPSLPAAAMLQYQGAPYGASAQLSNLGQSQADAGAPYAPSIYSLPQTLNGLASGHMPPFPPLPGYVSASYPLSPSSTQSQGGYQIAATASAADAKGISNIGVQQPGQSTSSMFASAETVAHNDGSVTSTGTSGIDAINFGSLLDIAKVSSTATMTEQASGQPKFTTQTNLGTVTLLGTTTGLATGGLGVLGQQPGIDLNSAVLPLLNQALAPSGVSISYLPEQFGYSDGTSSTGSTADPSKTVVSAASAALDVTVSQNVPSQGPSSVEFILGRVILSATDQPGFSFDFTPGTLTGIDTSGSAGVPSVAGSSFSASPLVANAPASNSLPSQTQLPGSIRSGLVNPSYILDKGPSTKGLYLILALVAFAVLAGSQAFRLIAVRLALSRSR